MPLEGQDKYRDLLEKFSEISSIKDPLQKQYTLIKASKESLLDKDSFLDLFKLYEIKQKEKLWLDRWYLKPWALLERRIELLAKSLKELDIFIVFQQLGNITVVFAAASFIFNTLPDRNKEIEKAWNTLESGKAGRRTLQLTLEKLVDYGESLESVNLEGLFIGGLDLSRANLKGANLKGANLKGADLRGANLKGADLRGVNLEEAELWGANLEEADLVGAHLIKADLSRANLKEAKLDEAGFNNALFCGTIMPNGDVNNNDCDSFR